MKHMRKHNGETLVFFDVDNTLFNGYTQKHLARYLHRKGILNSIDMLLVVVWFILYRVKIIKDETSGVNYLLSRFKGWSKKRVEAIFNEYFSVIVRKRLYAQGIAVARNHLKKGNVVVLLSTSLAPIIKRVAKEIGTPHIIATELAYAGGTSLGRVSGNVVTSKQKLVLAQKFIRERGALVTCYYAGHYSDYPLLKMVDNPFVVNPDKTLKELAQKHSWPVVSFT